MAELTQEQLEEAAKILLTNWAEISSSAYKESALKRISVAAPHLQLPWDEPTRDEINNLDGKDHTYTMVREFVRRRNHLFLPKPVDPRKSAIVKMFSEVPGSYSTIGPGNVDVVADMILAALDEVK